MTTSHEHLPTRTRRTGTAPRLVRVRLRILHLVVGALLGAYPYLPDTLPGHSALRLVLMLGIIPMVAMSGLLLWQQVAVRRWLRATVGQRD